MSVSQEKETDRKTELRAWMYRLLRTRKDKEKVVNTKIHNRILQLEAKLVSTTAKRLDPFDAAKIKANRNFVQRYWKL